MTKLTPDMSQCDLDTWIPNNFKELSVYWLVIYAQNRKAPSSVARDKITLRKYLIPAYGAVPLNQINARNVEFWFLNFARSSGLSSKTCNQVLGLFKKILNDATRWGFVDRNPLEYIRKIPLEEKDIVFWSQTEVQQFLGHWLAKEHRPKFLWTTILALYTGMRKGEILGLKWDAVDVDSGFITVKRSYCKAAKKVLERTKSKKIRRIPISKVLSTHLEELRVYTGNSSYVAYHFHPDAFKKIFKRMICQAGVKPIRFHDLRHSFASNFLMSGGNIYDLQKILGHSTIQVTERYTHLVPDHLKGKTEVLPY